MKLRHRIEKSIELGVIQSLLAVERLGSGVTWNPIRAESVSDPYPMYRRLREQDPVHYSRLIGGWVVSRYEDVASVLRDSRFSADDRNGLGYEKFRERQIKKGIISADDPDAISMLRSDPPDHTRLRTLVSKGFTPRAIKRVQPRVEELVRAQIDAVKDSGQMDVMRDLAIPLPIIVIAELLGIPPEDHAQFKLWSDEVVRDIGISTSEDNRVAARASRELGAYFQTIAETRRSQPRDDVLSALLRAEDEGDKLYWPEVVSTLLLLLVAGNETTTNLIGNSVLALLRNPEQLDRLRRDPTLIDNAVEELLRYDAPVQATSRRALEDLELGGRRIRRGQELILLIGAANRDPELFENPDELDLGRQENRHVSFGLGIHFCLGSALARYEARTAIGSLVERLPGIKLATNTPEFRPNAILRGLSSLPVSF